MRFCESVEGRDGEMNVSKCRLARVQFSAITFAHRNSYPG